MAGGDVCERRQWRIQRAKRSGRIKAIGERASHAMTEPLIQQADSRPYGRFRKRLQRADRVVRPYSESAFTAVGRADPGAPHFQSSAKQTPQSFTLSS